MDEQTATPKARTMEFSTRLKDLRAQSALSQEQLARRIGVSRQAITKWESGAGRPELESLVALADVFTVSVDALLGVARRIPVRKRHELRRRRRQAFRHRLRVDLRVRDPWV